MTAPSDPSASHFAKSQRFSDGTEPAAADVMRPFLIIGLAPAASLLLACSGGSQAGDISVSNSAGTESIFVNLVNLGTPSPTGGVEDVGSPVTVGACTVPPGFAIASPVPGDEGTPNTAASAGTISFVDSTSQATLGTFTSSSAGYTPLVGASPTTRWAPGDMITVTATGGDVGAFSQTVPALALPSVDFPSTFSATASLTLTWTPDPNAQTMSFVLDNGSDSEIICQTPDSVGTVTVDSSLFASFSAGTVTLSATRSTKVTFQDDGTSLQLISSADASASATISQISQ
jgi:hypothetical protein